jgi:hypothetical protein
MKESMLKPVRIEAGLGDPPKEYTNNDPEAANFMVKHALKFDSKRPHEFIDEIKNLIETQFRNEDRAVFGKGPCEIRPEFQHLAVNDQQWSKLGSEEKMRKLSKYLESGMGEKRLLEKRDAATKESASASVAMLLPVTASTSGVTTVPKPILGAMFDKANRLLQASNHVVPKPGASDGSFIVAGHGNTFHVVTPGKGSSLKCDGNCVNRSTSICEHVLAVAQVRGTLKEFLTWYRKSKKGPQLLEMALDSGPKNAGKKPSRRKRTNKKKTAVTQVTDLLNPSGSSPISHPVLTDVPAGISPAFRPVVPPAVPPVVPWPPAVPPVVPWPPAVPPVVPWPPAVPPVVPWPPAVPPVVPWPPVVSPVVPNAVPPFADPGSGQTPFLRAHLSIPPSAAPIVPQGSPHIAMQRSWYPFAAESCDGLYQMPLSSTQTNAFKLKWLAGTRVSRCYGCNDEIKNPP